MTEQTRRYSIRLTDLESDTDVVFTVVVWTDEEKRAAVAQVVRMAGVPEGAGQDFDDMIAPHSRASRNDQECGGKLPALG